MLELLMRGRCDWECPKPQKMRMLVRHVQTQDLQSAQKTSDDVANKLKYTLIMNNLKIWVAKVEWL